MSEGGTGAQVSRAALWSLGARAARFVLAIVTNVVVVRGLGDHDYGLLSVVRTAMAFTLVLTSGGMPQACLKFLPALKVEGDREGARKLVFVTLAVQIALWAALWVAILAARPLLDRFFPGTGLAELIALGVGFALGESLFRMVGQTLNAFYDTRLLSLVSVGSHLFYLALLFWALPRWGVMGVVGANALANVTAALALAGRVKRALTRIGPRRGSGLSWNQVATYALPFAAIGLLNMVVWRQSETLLLAHWWGAVPTGHFDLAYRLPQLALEFVPATAWPLVMAGVSEVYARDPSRLSSALERYYRALFFLSVPVAFAGAVWIGPAVPILFGDAMAPAVPLARVFFLVFMVSFLGTPMSMGLYVLRKSGANLVVYAVLAVINVGLDLLLIPRHGPMGALTAVAVVVILSPLAYHRMLRRYWKELRIPWGFLLRCVLGASPVLLSGALATVVRRPWQLAVAAVGAVGLILVGYRWARVVDGETRRWLESLPGGRRAVAILCPRTER
jgi:PST family polysaccharide transporter